MDFKTDSESSFKIVGCPCYAKMGLGDSFIILIEETEKRFFQLSALSRFEVLFIIFEENFFDPCSQG